MKKKINLIISSTIFLIASQGCAVPSTQNSYTDYMKCRYYFYKEDFDKAIQTCSKVKQIFKHSRKIYKDIIQAHLQKANTLEEDKVLGEYDKIAVLLQEYINQFKKPEDYLYVANTYLKTFEFFSFYTLLF